MSKFSLWRLSAQPGGKRLPYDTDEPCEHEYEADEDHDARELICPNCGHREPMPLDWPL